MFILFFAFGVLISRVSSAAAFNAAGSSLARQALRERCGRVHGKQHFSYSSVNHYQGNDFLDDS
jgi:hypothetical protein